jgi:hypothetical protein
LQNGGNVPVMVLVDNGWIKKGQSCLVVLLLLTHQLISMGSKFDDGLINNIMLFCRKKGTKKAQGN